MDVPSDSGAIGPNALKQGSPVVGLQDVDLLIPNDLPKTSDGEEIPARLFVQFDDLDILVFYPLHRLAGAIQTNDRATETILW
jgi:hypothetical protein